MTAAPPKDYYALLGIAPDATTRQIKSAYRKLAKTCHPDACPGDPHAAERFRELTEACETLTDPKRRKAYDATYVPAPGTGITTPPAAPAASLLLAVLEDTWKAIRCHHPEIPPVVIIIASGTDSKYPKWGHHAPGRWHASNTEHAEIMISGEGLRREPCDVLGTLLHEAAHVLADVRGITDTSRQGRYHNKKYARLAEELGLDVTDDEDGQFGWTITTVPGLTATRYESQLAALTAAMTLWRSDEHTSRATRRNTNLIAAVCPCGRSIRVAASTLAEAPITCQACDGHFESKN